MIALPSPLYHTTATEGRDEIAVLGLLAWRGHSIAGERERDLRHSRKGEEDAVHNCAHADVPGEHVIEVHEQGPPEFGRHVCSQQREQHAHNVQHHPLHSPPCNCSTAQWRLHDTVATHAACGIKTPESAI